MSTWAWGANVSGSLGIGSTTPNPETIPTLMTGDFIQASGSYLLAQDGSVWAHGTSPRLLPAGTYLTPTLVTTLSSIVAIDHKGDIGMALDSSGVLWGWGAESHSGSLGLGHTPPFTQSTAIAVATDVVAFSTGQTASNNSWSLIVHSTGVVEAAGYNANGQLGTSNLTSQNSWVTTTPPTGTVIKIATGFGGSAGWTLLLMDDGRVLGAGDGTVGQLADPVFTQSTVHPWKTVVAANAVDIWCGGAQTFFKLADGTLWGLGYEANAGMLPLSSGAFTSTPVQITVPSGVSVVDVSLNRSSFAVAAAILGSDDRLYVWGSKATGGFGDGTSSTTTVTVPANSTGLTGIKWVNDTGIAGNTTQFWAGTLVPLPRTGPSAWAAVIG